MLVMLSDAEAAPTGIVNAPESGRKSEPLSAGAKPSPDHVTVSRVLVKGDWIASSLVAGIADVTNDGFGRNDAVIAGDTTPDVLSRIASVVIKGHASGSLTAGDQYGITAQTLGKLTIAGAGVDLDPDEIDNILLDDTNNDFRVVEIG